jgi:imidazolonepropionase-like amidohydrolase
MRARLDAPKVAGALQRAGVLFAFRLSQVDRPSDFLRHVAQAVDAGLPSDAAARALAIDAARIAGAADRLGSIEKGKIANLLVTDGDLFSPKTVIRYVFIDGRPVELSRLAGR